MRNNDDYNFIFVRVRLYLCGFAFNLFFLSTDIWMDGCNILVLYIVTITHSLPPSLVRWNQCCSQTDAWWYDARIALPCWGEPLVATRCHWDIRRFIILAMCSIWFILRVRADVNYKVQVQMECKQNTRKQYEKKRCERRQKMKKWNLKEVTTGYRSLKQSPSIDS